jgi:gliding motility-associated-like protein
MQVQTADSLSILLPSIPNELCLSSQALTLPPAQPDSGSYFINGIAGNIINPSLLGEGTVIVSYAVQTEGCTYIKRDTINIIDVEDIQFTEILPLCSSDPPVELNAYVFPDYGTFSINGTPTTFLFPSQYPAGPLTILYEVNINDECNFSKEFTVFIKPSPPKPQISTYTGFTEFCNGDSLLVGVLPFTNILWSNGSTENEFFIQTSQTLWVQYTNNVGCTNRDTLTITELDPITLNLSSPVYPNGFNISTFGGNDGSIEIETNGGLPNYAYSFMSGINFDPPAQNLPSGWYTIIVSDSRNCIGIDSIYLTEPPFTPLPPQPDLPIAIPNSFTPNGDGFNDAFIIQNLINAPENKLSIFNRWGQLVFSAKNYQNNWFGDVNNTVSESTYFYIFEDLTNEKTYKGYVQTYIKK